MSVLNMRGCVDGVFQSVPATRTTTAGGSYVDGVWVPAPPVTTSFTVNIQPVSMRELDFLSKGGERITDMRRIYINSGPLDTIDLTGEWSFSGQRWKTVRVDNRDGRSYCKCFVERIDDQ